MGEYASVIDRDGVAVESPLAQGLLARTNLGLLRGFQTQTEGYIISGDYEH